jgi:putative Mg2+ transporter-C (MgtC) family protein
MACGAGLILLAVAVTTAYFVIAFLFPKLIRLLLGSPVSTEQDKEVTHD